MHYGGYGVSWISADLARSLRTALQSQSRINLFLRDDDVDTPEQSLETLLDICSHHNTPVTLAVVPGLLTSDAIAFLCERRMSRPDRIELHQHGWKHTDHEPGKRKCEFGDSRSLKEQCADIEAGNARMDAAFGSNWFPAFTPPWNRCTEDTACALENLGFSVLSTDRVRHRTPAYAFDQLPITLDLYRWKEGHVMRPHQEIIQELIAQIEGRRRIGILLHHKVMDPTAFAFLSDFLDRIAHHPHVRFHTFSSLTLMVQHQTTESLG